MPPKIEPTVPPDDAPPRRKPVPNQHFGYKQDRSLKTFERLLDAAEELLSEGHSSEALSVAEVCERAGLSVGAFYRRFESRDGLLTCLHERYVERVAQLQSHLLDPARWEGVDLPELVRRVIELEFDLTRREINLVRAYELRAQVDPGFARRERTLHAEYLALMTRLLLQRVEAIGHPNPRRAAEYCAYQVRAVLYYFFITSGALGESFDSSPSVEQVARDLRDSLCAYLQITP